MNIMNKKEQLDIKKISSVTVKIIKKNSNNDDNFKTMKDKILK